MAYALERMHYPPLPTQTLAATIGPPLRDAFAQFLQSDDAVRIEQAVSYYRERFGTVGLFENRVYDGIVPALAHLQADGRRLILATSKPHVYARRILEHFDLAHYFSAIHGSELDGTRDRKTELIAYILALENIRAADAVMIGDRSVDILGARANGVQGVGVLWGFGSAAELSAAAPWRLLDEVGALRSL